MAAPTTSYKSEKLPVIKGNSSGGIATQNDIYIAKFLQNTTPPSGDDWGDGYFNSTDTEAQKLAKIKDIFKIDGLVLVAKGAADGSAAETGFIGYCNSRTSGNGLYHKTERFSGVKVPIGASGGGAASTGELLNDASLNTKGNCSISAVTSDLENNAFKVTGAYRSAFYNATTAFGIEWSGISRKYTSTGGFEMPTTWTRDIDKGTRGVGQSSSKLTYTAETFSEPYNTDPYYELIAGEEYTITPYITNEEGRFEGTAITHLMSGISAQMSYGTTAALAAVSDTFETVYKWNRGLLAALEADGYTIQGTRFDMTANGSTGGDYPTAGWWAYPAASGTTIRLCVQLDEYGICTGILNINTSGGGSGSGTPAITQYTNIAGYSATSQAASITAARGNLWQTAYTLQWNGTFREWGWSELVGEELQWHTAEEGWYCRVAYIGSTEVSVEVLHIDAYGNLDASSGQMTVSKT